MYEFHYAFQQSRKIIFEVSYYTLGNNSSPYFTTSAEEFNQPKTDFSMCGQCQPELCKGYLKQFYEKWDYMHLKEITDERQFNELIEDIEDLKTRYNYIEKIADERPSEIRFSEIKELSMRNVR